MKAQKRIQITQDLIECYISGVEPSSALLDKAKKLEVDHAFIKEQAEKPDTCSVDNGEDAY